MKLRRNFDTFWWKTNVRRPVMSSNCLVQCFKNYAIPPMAPFASKATSRHSGIRWMSSTRCPTCQLNAGALRWRWKQRARSNTIMLLPERAGKAVNTWHNYFIIISSSVICPRAFSFNFFLGARDNNLQMISNAWCVFHIHTRPNCFPGHVPASKKV